MSRTWIERERLRQYWTIVVCIGIALALTTMDRPGPLIYAIDALVIIGVFFWRRVRSGAPLIELDKGEHGGRM